MRETGGRWIRWTRLGAAWWIGWASPAGAEVFLRSEVDVGVECFVGNTPICTHVDRVERDDATELFHQVSTTDGPDTHPLRNHPLIAAGTAQTRFGIHRLHAFSSPGGFLTADEIVYEYNTYAGSESEWSDHWTFTADGTFTASIDVRGEGSFATAVPLYDSPKPDRHQVGYRFVVRDLDNPQGGAFNVDQYVEEVPVGRFHAVWTLDFDYEVGHEYEVSGELFLIEENGWSLDFLSTAVITDVALSAGSLSTESGTDYTDLPVPEPAAPLLLLAGAAALSALRRRGERGGSARAPVVGRRGADPTQARAAVGDLESWVMEGA